MGATLKKGVNDLQTSLPALAREWHPTKNGALTPADVCVYSSQKVWWQIRTVRFGKTFTLEWQALVSNRANGSGCPFLSKPPRRLLKGFNDLATTNPKLAAMWHDSKNSSIRPDMIFEHTCNKYWWHHTVNRGGSMSLHEWQAAPNSMTPDSCPICHGSQIMIGFNDLVTRYPGIAAQWDWESNGELKPTEITYSSNKRIHWQCHDCGCRWATSVNNRTQGSGCPKCACRYSTSFPEQTLYYYLKQIFPNCINRDTSALDGLELDLYLPQEKIAIEYNGLWSHHSDVKQAHDRYKASLCKERNILLIRVCETEHTTKYYPKFHLIQCVENSRYSHLAYVMECISRELVLAGHLLKHIVINLERDRPHIYTQFFQTVKDKSLGSKFPELLTDWDHTKNGDLSPYTVFAHGGTKVHWQHKIVQHGKEYLHRWSSPVSARTSNGNGCPICAGKQVQVGFNDLQTMNPAFLKEWDFEKNSLIQTNAVTPGSNQKVWWKHSIPSDGKESEHTWQATIHSRMRGNGCPICDGKIIKPGFNDLTTTHPALLEEWDYEKNQLQPTDISYGYDKKLWWRHTVKKNGVLYLHSWSASPNSRTNCHSGCPYCSNKKVLKGYNDLATAYPETAKLWDFVKNAPLTPSEVTPSSAKPVWWLDRTKPIRISDRTKYR